MVDMEELMVSDGAAEQIAAVLRSHAARANLSGDRAEWAWQRIGDLLEDWQRLRAALAERDAGLARARADVERLRAENERWMEVFNQGHEPFRVGYAEPATFWNKVSPGYWYVASRSRMNGPARYLWTDGTLHNDCSNGHFASDADAQAVLDAWNAAALAPSPAEGDISIHFTDAQRAHLDKIRAWHRESANSNVVLGRTSPAEGAGERPTRDELLAIVAALPTTADGKPITPGMNLWHVCGNALGQAKMFRGACYVGGDSERCFYPDALDIEGRPTRARRIIEWADTFSTREAAVAAAAGEGVQP